MASMVQAFDVKVGSHVQYDGLWHHVADKIPRADGIEFTIDNDAVPMFFPRGAYVAIASRAYDDHG